MKQQILCVSNLLSGNKFVFKWYSKCNEIVAYLLTRCGESLDIYKNDIMNLEGMKTWNMEDTSVKSLTVFIAGTCQR